MNDPDSNTVTDRSSCISASMLLIQPDSSVLLSKLPVLSFWEFYLYLPNQELVHPLQQIHKIMFLLPYPLFHMYSMFFLYALYVMLIRMMHFDFTVQLNCYFYVNLLVSFNIIYGPLKMITHFTIKICQITV